MTRSLRAASLLLALAGFAGVVGNPADASAQCDAYGRCGVRVSAGARVVVPPPRGAQVVITLGPPPPPVVYVRPAPPPPPPPVVYYQPAPPPPPVVYVQPAPPPRPQVVYQQPVYQQPAYPPQPVAYPQPQRAVTGTTGLHFFVAGAGASSARMGGLGGAVRFRPSEHFGIDLGVAFMGGEDYHGRNRAEIPVTLDALYFINPQHKVQLYLLGGVGASFAYGEVAGTRDFQRTYTYVGGEAGVGVEFRLTRGFALNVDGRGFLRTQPRGTPEFVDGTTGETTRTSAGFVAQGGMTFYF